MPKSKHAPITSRKIRALAVKARKTPGDVTTKQVQELGAFAEAHTKPKRPERWRARETTKNLLSFA